LFSAPVPVAFNGNQHSLFAGGSGTFVNNAVLVGRLAAVFFIQALSAHRGYQGGDADLAAAIDQGLGFFFAAGVCPLPLHAVRHKGGYNSIFFTRLATRTPIGPQ
jgi:hypothetical protein